MRRRWPPAPLGLGTPLNLALASPETRPLLRRSAGLVLAAGVLLPVLMLGLDGLLFAGASLERVRELGSRPAGWIVLVVVYSGVGEELVYRLGISTLVAWAAHRLLGRQRPPARPAAQWIGIAVAAWLFGLAHVGNLPDVAHPVARAVTINGVAGLALGWLYWWRGLEAAVLTHMLAIAVLYLGVPALLGPG